MAMKPIPVRLKEIYLDVVTIRTIVSIDFIIVVSALYFLYFFLDLLFLSLKNVIVSLMLSFELLELLLSFSFLFNCCSKPSFSNDADGNNLSRFWSIYIA